MQPSERYINWSCGPNASVRTIHGEGYLLARRTIAAGEEVTYHYVVNCHGAETWRCNCGSPRCRGVIVSSFFDLPLEQQLAHLPLLDEWFAKEHQRPSPRPTAGPGGVRLPVWGDWTLL